MEQADDIELKIKTVSKNLFFSFGATTEAMEMR